MADAVNVTLITTVNCHLCEELKAGVEKLAHEHALTIQEVGWADGAGRQLVERDGVPFPPALYVNGVFRGYGRFSERRLRQILTQS